MIPAVVLVVVGVLLVALVVSRPVLALRRCAAEARSFRSGISAGGRALTSLRNNRN